LPLLAAWALAWLVTAALVWLAVRRGWLRSPFAIALTTAVGFLAAGSVAVGAMDLPGQSAVVTRGRIGLLEQYDGARLRAVDVTPRRRFRDDDVLQAAALTTRHEPDAAGEDPRALEPSFALPEGRYEARVWFEGDPGQAGDAFVALSDRVVLARAA